MAKVMIENESYEIPVGGLVLVRGIPGSGKTTLANKLAETVGNAVVLEADQYFMVEGEYRFNATQLGQAHKWCLNRTRTSLAECRTVFVANTFTRRWEMQKYIALAIETNRHMAILEASTPWCKNAEECARRNTHGVPLASIERMLQRWQTAPFNIMDVDTAAK